MEYPSGIRHIIFNSATPIDMSRKAEAHMPSDRPGMIMRNRLLALLKQHGEEEVYNL
jgi:hypothetical protein